MFNGCWLFGVCMLAKLSCLSSSLLLYSETMNWTLLRESLINMLLVYSWSLEYFYHFYLFNDLYVIDTIILLFSFILLETAVFFFEGPRRPFFVLLYGKCKVVIETRLICVGFQENKLQGSYQRLLDLNFWTLSCWIQLWS